MKLLVHLLIALFLVGCDASTAVNLEDDTSTDSNIDLDFPTTDEELAESCGCDIGDPDDGVTDEECEQRKLDLGCDL
jgi:hypothetical protein